MKRNDHIPQAGETLHGETMGAPQPEPGVKRAIEQTATDQEEELEGLGAGGGPVGLIESGIEGFEGGEELGKSLPGGDPGGDSAPDPTGPKSPLERLPQTTSLAELASRGGGH